MTSKTKSPRPTCEHCKKGEPDWCVDGWIWLCWDCYCKFMREQREK